MTEALLSIVAGILQMNSMGGRFTGMEARQKTRNSGGLRASGTFTLKTAVETKFREDLVHAATSGVSSLPEQRGW